MFFFPPVFSCFFVPVFLSCMEKQYLKIHTLAVHRWVVCNTAPDWWMNCRQCISVSGVTIRGFDHRTTNTGCVCSSVA